VEFKNRGVEIIVSGFSSKRKVFEVLVSGNQSFNKFRTS
jgi:hypothetical protein